MTVTRGRHPPTLGPGVRHSHHRLHLHQQTIFRFHLAVLSPDDLSVFSFAFSFLQLELKPLCLHSLFALASHGKSHWLFVRNPLVPLHSAAA